MFNFSTSHFLLLSRTECSTFAVFLLRDIDTQHILSIYDFSKAQLIRPGVAYCVSGKVNRADKLYLVIESVRPDTKHVNSSTGPVPADGAGGCRLADSQKEICAESALLARSANPFADAKRAPCATYVHITTNSHDIIRFLDQTLEACSNYETIVSITSMQRSYAAHRCCR